MICRKATYIGLGASRDPTAAICILLSYTEHDDDRPDVVTQLKFGIEQMDIAAFQTWYFGTGSA